MMKGLTRSRPSSFWVRVEAVGLGGRGLPEVVEGARPGVAGECDHEHDAGEDAGQEQAADRGFRGDAIKDEGDGGGDQDAEGAAGADRAGSEGRADAAAEHLRHADLADRGGGRRRGAADGGEDAAGEDVGDDEAAGQAGEPSVQALVDVRAGPADADRCAQQDKERDGEQGEAGDLAHEGNAEIVQRARAAECRQEADRDER